MTHTVHIIEDDPIFAELIAKAVKKADCNTEIFHDAITAIQNLDDNHLPALIFLDILLTGPDGFTYLNELASYSSTNEIPVVIVSTLDFKGQDLSPYGVIKILDKSTMHPSDITKIVQQSAVQSSEITEVEHARH